MARSHGFCVAVTVVSLFALSGTSVAADPPSASLGTDAASIYKSFLSHWAAATWQSSQTSPTLNLPVNLPHARARQAPKPFSGCSRSK